MKPLSVRTSGVSSRIPDSLFHILCLDYDNIDDERLKEELTVLQSEFKLGDFYVLKTRDYGRHAVCIDALTFRDVKKVIDFSSCDTMFKKAPMINEYRCWVLRYAKKGNRDEPKYLYTVKSEHEGKNQQSRGHSNYLLKFGIECDLLNPIGTNEIETQDYNTGTRTDKQTVEETT